MYTYLWVSSPRFSWEEFLEFYLIVEWFSVFLSLERFWEQNQKTRVIVIANAEKNTSNEYVDVEFLVYAKSLSSIVFVKIFQTINDWG